MEYRLLEGHLGILVWEGNEKKLMIRYILVNFTHPKFSSLHQRIQNFLLEADLNSALLF